MKKIFLFFILELVINSCKKYPEDEANIHLRTATKRIIGEWFVTKYEVDGIDSTVAFENNPNYYCKYVFHRRANQYDFLLLDKYNCLIGRVTHSTWSFYGKNRLDIGIGADQSSSNSLPWQILELDYRKLKLEMTDRLGTNYKVELIKIK